jgi:uncharacterized RDD family membrane protein YckC
METQTDRIKCPYCAEDISVTAKKCRHCGEWLVKESGPHSVATHGTNYQNSANMHYAGFWIRFVAHIIDSILMGLVYYLLPLAGFIVYFAYYLFLTYQYQATLGKMAMGIKVVSSSNLEKASIGSIVMRETLGKIVSGLILFIGYFMTGFTQKKQALHDFMAETLVVYKN